MASSTIEVKIDGVEDMRRLSAALEQYNAGSQPQVEALRAELDKVRRQLHNGQGEVSWAAALIVGGPVALRAPGRPYSLIESVAVEARKQIDELRCQLAEALDSARAAELEQSNAEKRADELHAKRQEANDELAYAYNIISNRNMRLPGENYKTDLLNEVAGLVDRDVRREIGAAELAKAHDRIHQLEQIHDQQVVSLKATRDQVETLQRESNSGSDRVRKDLAEAHERICKQNDVIANLQADLHKSRNVVHFVDDEARKVREALGLGKLAQVPEVIAAIEGLRNDARISGARAEVIKHLHEEYHQLQARKMGAEFDLERAKEEIAFAEAEIDQLKKANAFFKGAAQCL